MPATFLFAWELGGGWGHLGRINPLAQLLQARGHRTIFAVQQLDRLLQIAPDQPLFQAPLITSVANPVKPMLTLADILHNAGADQPETLKPMMHAWRCLIQTVKPDALVGDYAPFASLAAKSLELPRLILTNGFDTPPDTESLQPFRQLDPANLAIVRKREQMLLEIVNQTLSDWDRPPLSRLAQWFNDVDHLAIANFPELDPYPQRQDANYWGVWNRINANHPPPWPKANGPKLFAYLRKFPNLNVLLDKLADSRCATLVYIPKADEALRDKYSSLRLTILDYPVDLQAAARRADAYIGHGLNAAAKFLQYGKPALCLPLQAEQTMLAQRLTQHGFGVGANVEKPKQLHAALDHLLAKLDQYQQHARRFAQQYAEFDPEVQVQLLVDQLESMVA